MRLIIAMLAIYCGAIICGCPESQAQNTAVNQKQQVTTAAVATSGAVASQKQQVAATNPGATGGHPEPKAQGATVQQQQTGSSSKHQQQSKVDAGVLAVANAKPLAGVELEVDCDIPPEFLDALNELGARTGSTSAFLRAEQAKGYIIICRRESLNGRTFPSMIYKINRNASRDKVIASLKNAASSLRAK